jgi:hypothetical protein
MVEAGGVLGALKKIVGMKDAPVQKDKTPRKTCGITL